MIHPSLNRIRLQTDLCVIGGGISGFCAAIAAAREGISVILVHDRPVLGGNASSEIRMSIGGIRDMRYREGGILEELFLKNAAMNPYSRYPLWDVVLYDMIMREKNIKLLLNCSCLNASCENNCIQSVDCYMMPSQTWYTIQAKHFADCSGDSILAPLTGAHFMHGREAKETFGESNAPVTADKYTMGNSILMQLEHTEMPEPFTEPDWADHYVTDDISLQHWTRDHSFSQNYSTNFWWMERGGMQDTITNADEIRHSLYALALGVYGHLKNSHSDTCSNLTLHWLGALPGKRESRRYRGPFVLTSNDITSDRSYPDAVAYGGWPMDNHDPRGFDNPGPGNVCYPVPMPYQIPLRCLYSENIDNLWFAGRNISVSHEALTSTRVSATCALLGQAVGTAAAFATKQQLKPRELSQAHIDEIRQTLLLRDCYLPNTNISHAKVMQNMDISGTCVKPSCAANGKTRSIDSAFCSVCAGDTLTYHFHESRRIESVELYFNSDFERKTCTDHLEMAGSIMNVHSPLKEYRMSLPKTLAKSFEITTPEGFSCKINNNIYRHVHVPIRNFATSITFRLLETTGNEAIALYAMELI